MLIHQAFLFLGNVITKHVFGHSLSIEKVPEWSLIIEMDRESPNPVPLPTGFVVKKGRNIFS